MRKTREVLRLHYELKLGQRQIARSVQISQSTVHDYLDRFAQSGLSWPLRAGVGEVELEAAMFPPEPAVEAVSGRRTMPDFVHIQQELQQHKHTTLQLLWEEYRAVHPDGCGYSRFCYHYQQWKQQRDLIMRQEHHPGEKLFVDWAGKQSTLCLPWLHD